MFHHIRMQIFITKTIIRVPHRLKITSVCRIIKPHSLPLTGQRQSASPTAKFKLSEIFNASRISLVDKVISWSPFGKRIPCVISFAENGCSAGLLWEERRLPRATSTCAIIAVVEQFARVRTSGSGIYSGRWFRKMIATACLPFCGVGTAKSSFVWVTFSVLSSFCRLNKLSINR